MIFSKKAALLLTINLSLVTAGFGFSNTALTPSTCNLSGKSIIPLRNNNVGLGMIATNDGSETSSSSAGGQSRRKKTVRDRTQAEATSLIRDIVQAAIEAGPRAAPARTLQAYIALTTTIRDFLPIPETNTSLFGLGRPVPFRQPEEFSAPKALRKLFERMGATYIKLGQFIASSPTLFPKEYVLEFQKCLDATEPLEWSVIQKVIEKELGAPMRTVFQSVDKEPLASASIAQVHAAKLKTGEDVVIKVQKPRIDESLKADLSFIYVASRVLEFLQPDFERTSLSAIAEDIRSSMLEELDFEKEATNVEEFRTFLADNDLRGVATAPRIYREYLIISLDYLILIRKYFRCPIFKEKSLVLKRITIDY